MGEEREGDALLTTLLKGCEGSDGTDKDEIEDMEALREGLEEVMESTDELTELLLFRGDTASMGFDMVVGDVTTGVVGVGMGMGSGSTETEAAEAKVAGVAFWNHAVIFGV